MNSKQLAVVISVTFFAGMVWLISDIIFNTKASIEISPKLQTLLEPISPGFNTRVLEIIDTEVQLPDETGSFQNTPEPTPTPSTSPSPSLSPSPTPRPSPSVGNDATATESGAILQ